MSTKSQKKLVSIQHASVWATNFLCKEISPTNIFYLIQYGKLEKYMENGTIQVCLEELEKYYHYFYVKRKLQWKEALGSDLHWLLSFDQFCEKDTTKYIHGLHPYKGKFIPQLVEYFLDDHTDSLKTQRFLKKEILF